ncbi:MAG: DUF5808 domain-containing protein [Coriobacteriales bacterium]|jgi:uncharacterized membrane protein|nr:DUF5808 domain-containing protein [Coriobacteriales bacterium]
MLLAILLIADLLLITCFAFIPYVTRRTELFGVTLPAEHSRDPELMRLRASYRNQMLVAGALLVALSVWLGLAYPLDDTTPSFVYLAAVCVYLLLSFALYLPKHYVMKHIKAQRGWDLVPTDKTEVVLADTTPPARDVVSPVWLLLFPLIILLTLGAVWFVWPQVPDVVPIHFNLEGVADGFASKGPVPVLLSIGAQVFMAALYVFIYVLIRRTKRQIDASNPRTSRLQDVRFRRLLSGFLIGMGALLELMFGALLLMSLLGVQQMWLILGPSLALLVLVFVFLAVFMFRVGQGGSRLRDEPTEAAPPSTTKVNVDDDRYWKLGQFYFNPADPALFVEKRFGIGYTCNFGRPAAWVLIGACIVLIVAVLVAAFLLVPPGQ